MNDMMSTLVASIARQWPRLYTLGLPAEVRDERRAELDSDLWEQRRDAAKAPGRSNATLQMALRMVLGVPDDLLWRFGQARVSKWADEPDGSPKVLKSHKGGTVMIIGKTFRLAIRPVAYMRLFALALGLLLLFPLGVAALVAVVVGFTVPAAFAAAPLIYRRTDIDLGPIAVDTLGEALLMSLVGLLGLLLLLHLSNGAAALLARFVSIRIGSITLGRTES